MELNHLRYFYEVARLGSFTKASRTLRISQPSVSKIIKVLEDREGVQLFDRGKRKSTLTPEGKKVFEACQIIFREVENLREEIKLQKDSCVGDLNIAASDNVCNYLLPSLVKEYWNKYPRVRFEIFSGTSDTIRNELTSGKFELGMFFTYLRVPELVFEKLTYVEFVVVCSPKNKLLMEKKEKGLEAAYYIGSRVGDYQKPYPAMQMLHSLGIRPKLFFETNNQETQKRMAMQEYGYTIVPHYMVLDEIKNGRLTVLKTKKKVGTYLYLVCKKNRTLSPPARSFESFIKSRIPQELLLADALKLK